MDIVLLRHGQSEANAQGLIQGRTDSPLSNVGREQAIRTADALLDFKPFRIYTSPLARASETAQIINRPHNAEVVILDELVEFDLGECEGLSGEELIEMIPSLPRRMEEGVPFHHLLPGAETDEEVDLRAERALHEILHSGLPRCVVVSHLGILERIIVAAARKHSSRDFSKDCDFPLKNCSITRMRIRPLNSMLLTANDTAHIEPGH